jgi:hypothetical protein
MLMFVAKNIIQKLIKLALTFTRIRTRISAPNLPLILILILLPFVSLAQPALKETGPKEVEAIVYLGDTIPYNLLNIHWVNCKLTAAQKEALAKYNRLRNAVYVTYPYARKAGVVLNDINANLEKITGNKKQRQYIHSREKELKKEFTTPLTNLSIYQGKVLMKLINRETGNNCYNIIKEYKGGLTARLYQTVAFFFNSNLKQPYDPQKEDLVIEKIVLEVQKLYGFPEISKKATL